MKKKQEIINLMNGEEPVVLHFYFTDCKKAKENQSALHYLYKAKDGPKIKTVNIEMGRQPKLVEDLEIEGAPMLVLFVQGKERWRSGGAIEKDRILKMIECFVSEN